MIHIVISYEELFWYTFGLIIGLSMMITGLVMYWKQWKNEQTDPDEPIDKI